MLADLFKTSADAWVETLVLLGLLVGIGYLLYRKGLFGKLRRRVRSRPPERHPYQGDAEDFDHLLKF